MYEYFTFPFSLFFVVKSNEFIKPPTINLDFFPSTADNQPCDGPPSRLLEYYFSLDIGATDVTKNSRLFAVTTARSTLLLAVI